MPLTLPEATKLAAHLNDASMDAEAAIDHARNLAKIFPNMLWWPEEKWPTYEGWKVTVGEKDAASPQPQRSRRRKAAHAPR